MKVMNASSSSVAKLIPPRSSRSKKGDNGIVLVAGGSRIYHGAPLLAALAAMRSGADLVYLAVPRSISTPIRAYSPSVIVLPLPDDRLTVGSVNKLRAMLPKRVDAAAIGMGMSIAKIDALTNLIGELNAMGARILLDASALIPNALPAVSDRGAVLTPHAGEFKRVFQKDAGESERERVENVRRCAAESNVTVLLKGWTDVISDGKRVCINKTHSCAMTIGGTGDVLSGLVAGLLAKRIDAFEASMAGAYINGYAGMLAHKRLGLHMLPTDLIEEIPFTMKKFDRVK
jgi:NAD(P)H-hydrate epimerase